jgi:hypothetical protein
VEWGGGQQALLHLYVFASGMIVRVDLNSSDSGGRAVELEHIVGPFLLSVMGMVLTQLLPCDLKGPSDK